MSDNLIVQDNIYWEYTSSESGNQSYGSFHGTYNNWVMRAGDVAFQLEGPGIDDGLLAYYPLNGNANDESGNTRNGVENGVTYSSGVLGSAVEFTGSGGYIDFDPVGLEKGESMMSSTCQTALLDAANCRAMFCPTEWYGDLISRHRGPANQSPIILWP